MARIKRRKSLNDSDPSLTCPLCGKMHDVRQDLGVKATRAEVDKIILLNNIIASAAQASAPVNLAPAVTKENLERYLAAILNIRADAMAQARAWWQDILTKYDLPKDINVFIDYNTCDFYIALPQKG
ncbi:MAG: hypothetical protein LBK68_07035 [Candidatus Margulisbacteria bacterium]|jgi:hypothetical protein|nr:hypothetical protein [Candidatus Margulisiibacteriota bacterium]